MWCCISGWLEPHTLRQCVGSSSSSSSSSNSGRRRWRRRRRRRRRRSTAPAAELKLVSRYKEEEENLPRQEMLSDSCYGHFNKQDGQPWHYTNVTNCNINDQHICCRQRTPNYQVVIISHLLPWSSTGAGDWWSLAWIPPQWWQIKVPLVTHVNIFGVLIKRWASSNTICCGTFLWTVGQHQLQQLKLKDYAPYQIIISKLIPTT